MFKIYMLFSSKCTQNKISLGTGSYVKTNNISSFFKIPSLYKTSASYMDDTFLSGNNPANKINLKLDLDLQA